MSEIRKNIELNERLRSKGKIVLSKESSTEIILSEGSSTNIPNPPKDFTDDDMENAAEQRMSDTGENWTIEN